MKGWFGGGDGGVLKLKLKLRERVLMMIGVVGERRGGRGGFDEGSLEGEFGMMVRRIMGGG